jgi:transposase
MNGLPAGTRVWLVAGVTDMQRGIDGLLPSCTRPCAP